MVSFGFLFILSISLWGVVEGIKPEPAVEEIPDVPASSSNANVPPTSTMPTTTTTTTTTATRTTRNPHRFVPVPPPSGHTNCPFPSNFRPSPLSAFRPYVPYISSEVGQQPQQNFSQQPCSSNAVWPPFPVPVPAPQIPHPPQVPQAPDLRLQHSGPFSFYFKYFILFVSYYFSGFSWLHEHPCVDQYGWKHNRYPIPKWTDSPDTRPTCKSWISYQRNTVTYGYTILQVSMVPPPPAPTMHMAPSANVQVIGIRYANM